MYCKVTEQIFGITRLLEDEKKKPKDYGNGVLLYHAEVQLLDTIARYPSDNVSALSERLGITKGAITQMVEKLRQKELIETIKREDNKKEKYFCLTDKGRISIRGHQQLHQQANTSLCDFVSTLNSNEADAVFRFLGSTARISRQMVCCFLLYPLHFDIVRNSRGKACALSFIFR